MTDHSLAALLRLIAERSAGRERFITALAGPPGAGKSTTSRLLAAELPNADILQADGYHYDNMLLEQRGLKHRKGAPETFDVGGMADLLRRIRAGQEVVAPVFDRPLDLARAGAVHLPAHLEHVVVEGNYLAMRSTDWAQLRPCFDLVVLIDVPENELRRRLVQRWRDLGCSEAEVTAHVEGNDMLNVALVRAESQGADFILRF